MAVGVAGRSRAEWWRSAVVYQVYLRSFADGNGDGEGDIAGLRQRLRHIADLGVDAIWINPWYPSPLADGGYDVADYRDIDPRFGTLADADALIAEAHDRGLRVLLDIVPNHTSDAHSWFVEAVAAEPGSAARDRYIFADGRGRGGDEPPNDWEAMFGGPAWHRVKEPDGTPGQWYLHLFAPEQPDLNWDNPEVREEFESILRFWFDRGVDGFRIDVAHALVKDRGLPDVAGRHRDTFPPGTHPFWDREDVHGVYRGWRRVADAYDPPRVFVAEAWVNTAERLADYLRPDELHTAFGFTWLRAPFTAAELRPAIDDVLRAVAPVGAPATWVLSNHDIARHVSRLARDPARLEGWDARDLVGLPADLELGRRRARAAILLMLALPGVAYLYQGEELGLEEVEDLPDEALQDPTWLRSSHTIRGRDGCRVPLPWSGTTPPYGFGPPGGADPWLPQPHHWAPRTAEAQGADPDSFLSLYRRALALRRECDAFGGATLQWLESPDGVLAFERPDGLVCMLNLGAAAVELPAGAEVLLASEPGAVSDGLLPDTAVWLRR